MTIVIGSGADGLRAAAMLASTGVSVCLLQESETSHGLVHPALGEGTGRLHIDPSSREAAERILGPLVDAPPVQRWISCNGVMHGLPLTRRSVATIFERDQLADVGRRFVERRVRNGLIPLTGEGQEERTYREWVVRRMGDPAYQNAYSNYARKRWGLDGDSLSVAVARAHHNPHPQPSPVMLGGDQSSWFDLALETIQRNGGEVHVGANVRGFKVSEGRVVAVKVGRKHVATDGPVWVARTPSVVAGWLGDALPSGGHVDAGLLEAHDRVRVAFDVEHTIEADEVHLLDGSADAFRVVQSYGSTHTVVFDATVSPYAPDPDVEELARCAQRLGWKSADPSTARIERLHEWVPLWAPVVHPRLRRLSLAFRELGIVSVGRRGTFAPIDAGSELMLAARYAGDADPDQREAMRVLLDPPVKDDDLNASFRDFIWR